MNVTSIMSFRVKPELKSLIQEWLAYLSDNKGYSRHTIQAYLTDLYYFLSFISTYHGGEVVGLETLVDITLQDMRSWLAARNIADKKNTSNARALSVVRAFYKYLRVHHGCDNQSPFLVKLRNKDKPLPKALSVDAAISAITSIKELYSNGVTEWTAKRDYAVLMLLYGCGLRISEALSFRMKDVMTMKTGVLVIKGKGNKERVVPVLLAVTEAVEDYIKSCPFALDEGSIFRSKSGKNLSQQSYRKIISKLKNYILLPDFTSPHAFRHSFATHLLASNGDIRSIQELLGHQAISTTQRYTKVEASKLLSVYESFHPRATK